MMIRRIGIKGLFFFVLLSLSESCIERFNPSATSFQYGYLVIDGFLINGTDSTIIKLSRTQTLANVPADVRELNAMVQIEEENGITYTLRDNHNGNYSIAPLDLSTSKNYRLKVRTSDTKEYVSDFVPVRKSAPVDKVTWAIKDDYIRISIDTHDPANEARYYFWTYEETWGYHSSDYSQYVYQNGDIVPRKRSDEVYFCWRTQSSNKLSVFSTKALSSDVVADYDLLHIPFNARRLYSEYSIRAIQHAITEEAYQYWVATIKNSENMGSLYSPLPSQVVGNIHCINNPSEPVIGFFSASSIESNRASFTRQEIPGPHEPYEPSGYESCGGKFVPLSYQGFQSVLIIEKKYNDQTQELIGYSVDTRDCMDCRSKGGTTTRPPFWN